MRKDQKLKGAALESAARKKAKKTGYSVVVARGKNEAISYEPDGRWRVGKNGDYEFCPNFGPGSP